MSHSNPEKHSDILIVGAGVAGLCCARALQTAGRKVRILEKADAPGGRVRTDLVDGYLLDRGFQVLLTAYPTLSAWLDYRALDLKPFAPGAKIFRQGRWETLSDPLRRPAETFRTLSARTGSIVDKVRVLQARARAARGTLDDLFARPESSTAEALQRAGFSEEMQDAFWRPFLRGVMLEHELATSSRFYEFVLRMFAGADVAVPARGMGEIPKALAAGLAPGSLHCNRDVVSVSATSVEVAGGETWTADHVVLAVDPRCAARWENRSPPRMNGGVTLWFAADAAPMVGPWLLLNGQGHDRVNHVAVMSEVSDAYAPAGKALICANWVGQADESDDRLIELTRSELSAWFGAGTSAWSPLRVQRIPESLPEFAPPTQSHVEQLGPNEQGIWGCGDYRKHPSLEGAASSGVETAQAILQRVK